MSETFILTYFHTNNPKEVQYQLFCLFVCLYRRFLLVINFIHISVYMMCIHIFLLKNINQLGNQCNAIYAIEKEHMIMNMGSRIRFLRFKYILYCFIAMCSQASYLISLGFSFLIYKTGITLVAISWFIIRIVS